MSTVLLIIFLFVSLAMIGLILIQRSEGGGLGIGGGGQGMGGLMTGRGTANLLTRTTSILGALFFVLALVLALLGRGNQKSLLDTPVAGPAENRPVDSEAPPVPAPDATATPAAPAKPAVPVN